MKPITIVCTALDEQARGLFKYHGKMIALKGLLPGEEALVDLTNEHAPRLVKVTKPSNERIQPICHQYQNCGGCQLLHMNDEAKCNFKTNLVKETFKPLKSMMDVEIEATHMAEDPWYYRNKIQMPISKSAKNALLIGFYKENSIEIIEKDDCFIQAKIAQKVLKELRTFIKNNHITPFDWKTHRGSLKYILIRYGFTSGQLMVVVVTNGPDAKWRKNFVSTMTRNIPEITTIVQNVNTRKDHLVLDNKENVWYGSGVIMDKIGDIKFLISPRSFYQINPPQVKRLYDTIKEYAALTKKETVFDAYCGVGTIGLYLASEAKQVFGVELVKDAIEDAKKNAKLNNITNARFQVGDASSYMVKQANEHRHVDVVIVDPPRSGCSPELIQSVLTLQPDRFIYVSCNILTQVRDLELMKNSGYRIEKMSTYDLFPQTYHVESVVLLTRA